MTDSVQITNVLKKDILVSSDSIKPTKIIAGTSMNLKLIPNSPIYFELFQNKPILYSKVIFNPKNRKIDVKKIYLGQVTSRNIVKNFGRTSIGGGYGQPFINIHNLTLLPLKINNFEIPPYSIGRYKGPYHMGVELGTVLQNKDGLYLDFIILKPITDVYYGLVSTYDQPLYGGFDSNFMETMQWEFNEDINKSINSN